MIWLEYSLYSKLPRTHRNVIVSALMCPLHVISN